MRAQTHDHDDIYTVKEDNNNDQRLHLTTWTRCVVLVGLITKKWLRESW